jgi:hypothetical protein
MAEGSRGSLPASLHLRARKLPSASVRWPQLPMPRTDVARKVSSHRPSQSPPEHIHAPALPHARYVSPASTSPQASTSLHPPSSSLPPRSFIPTPPIHTKPSKSRQIRLSRLKPLPLSLFISGIIHYSLAALFIIHSPLPCAEGFDSFRLGAQLQAEFWL